MGETAEPTISFANRLVLAVALLGSFSLGGGVVLFGLSIAGLGRYTTGAAGQVAGVAGGLAGLAALFAYLSYRYYRLDERQVPPSRGAGPGE